MSGRWLVLVLFATDAGCSGHNGDLPEDSDTNGLTTQYYLGSAAYTVYGSPFGETDRAASVESGDGSFMIFITDRTPKIGSGDWTLTLEPDAEADLSGELTTGEDVYAVVATRQSAQDDAMRFPWDATGVAGSVQCRPTDTEAGAEGQWEFFSPGGNSEILLRYTLAEVSASEYREAVDGWSSP